MEWHISSAARRLASVLSAIAPSATTEASLKLTIQQFILNSIQLSEYDVQRKDAWGAPFRLATPKARRQYVHQAHHEIREA